MAVKKQTSSSNPDKSKRVSSRKVTEEEITQYLIKKAIKQANKLNSKTSSSVYPNDSNSFGDSNLGEKFLWRKKIERDVARGEVFLSVKTERKRERERMEEVERVKKRREEREYEKRRRQEERELLERERARSEFQDWQKKEEEFLFNQSKIRSDIRVRQGRTKPIDVLSVYIGKVLDGSDVEVELEEPYRVFVGLSLKEMEELRDEIEMNLDSDKGSRKCRNYWNALLDICKSEVTKATKKDDQPRGFGEDCFVEQRGFHSSIQSEVINALKGKTSSELRKHSHPVEASSEHDPILQQPNVKDATEAEEESFSPQLLCGDSSEKEAIDPEEDRASLERTRMVVIEELKNKNQETMVAVEEGDVIFGSGAEVNLDSLAEWWHDKFRPRKPKYFNAVHTGYEWNKYNRTHYDHANPPPKIVRGYKFNIFYPDLIKKTETPTYTRESDHGSNGETCIIRFQAGPPYEDIAFRIVDK